MPSPFLIAANPLRTNGLSVIPLLPHSKRPAIEKWSDYGVQAADDKTFERWLKWKDCNIGVCLGVASNLVAVDYDHDIGGLHEKIESLLPPSPVGKVGAKGKTMFYAYNGQKSQGYSKDGQRVLDILSQGRQCVLPPSIHPDGFPYKWLSESTLENTPTSALPHIPITAIHEIGKIFTPEPRIINEARHIMVYDDTKKSEVADALDYIPAEDYDLWIRIGMCLKDKFGEAAFGMWDKWSSTSSKYNQREMQAKWKSFHGQGLTIASLFYHSMDNGYSCAPIDYLDGVEEDFELNGKKTGLYVVPKSEMIEIAQSDTPSSSRKTDSIIFPSELLDAPGLPGKIESFINRTSLMPQPVLALGAALSLAGNLMGRKVRSETNLRTNFYIIGLAPSGSGKDHARTIVKRMLHDSGLGHTELGVPASSAGLVSGLRDRGEGRGLILWDEFGRILKQISGWKAGSHERDTVTALIELFSSAQSVYMGKSYANHDGRNPMKPIDQPCLSIYATSVPSHFYEALSGSEAIDGFLSRWLIFESKDYTMEEEDHEQTFAEVPQSLVDICKFWKEQSFNSEPNQGNLADAVRVVPRLIKASGAANACLKSFATDMRKTAIMGELRGDNTGSIWSRAGEHARRLALVAHEGDQIELKVAEWAVAMAKFCCTYMASAISDYVSSTELESQTKRILRCIRDKGSINDGWVTRADLTRSFQGIQTRTRMEILGSLVERCEIKEEKVAVGAGRPTFRYRAT
jgi:hypothetical protein